jgi:tetratricopeptide (TPR) repeat protein
MVFPVPPPISEASRLGSFAAPAVWLAVALGIPLAGCSFDLGSWGSDNDKPKAAAEKPADPISPQNVSDAKGHATRGQVLARSGKNDDALAEFDAVPYNTQALFGRGLIYQGQNQHQRAIEDFTAANGLTPQRVEPLLGRATSYLAVDKAKEAAADLDEAVQADPQNAQGWLTRGLAYERLGDKTRAAGSYGRAINLRPKDDTARAGFVRVGG